MIRLYAVGEASRQQGLVPPRWAGGGGGWKRTGGGDGLAWGGGEEFPVVKSNITY